MGMSLEEYAAQNPMEEPEEERRGRERINRTIKERQEIADKAEYYKDSIAEQLDGGNAPQYILYTAIKCIGLLTDDDEWAEEQANILDSVYEDLAQECIHIDTAAVEMFRLKTKKAEFHKRVRGHLSKDLSACNKLQQALEKALEAVQIIDDFEFWEEKKKMEPIEKELQKLNKK